MNLLTVKDMQALQELKFYYKFIHNKLPAYLKHWQLITNIKIHNHNTRRQNEIHIVGIKHSFAKRSLIALQTQSTNNIKQYPPNCERETLYA